MPSDPKSCRVIIINDVGDDNDDDDSCDDVTYMMITMMTDNSWKYSFFAKLMEVTARGASLVLAQNCVEQEDFRSAIEHVQTLLL